MNQFTGSTNHPLLADWNTYFQGQEYTYASEWRILAARGMSLACNDPFIAALINAAMQVTLGPSGLRLNSLFDSTPEDDAVSLADRRTRRILNSICESSWYGKDLDAEGSRNRREIEALLLWMSWAIGEGFAIRTWKNGRSVWRIVMPDRVRNPGIFYNTANVRDGFRLDDSGHIIGLWCDSTNYVLTGQYIPSGVPVYVPWFAADGTPNVIHRKGFTLPGMLRGVTRLAPMIVMSRQIGEVMQSHAAAKRLQAIQGMIVDVEDESEYQAARATGDALDPYSFSVKGPLNVWVKRNGQTVEFPKTEFSGDDLAAYCRHMYMVQCAAVGMPVDVVLCNLGSASLSSARAGLDQLDRFGQTEQEQHISECSNIIDRVEISDQIALGKLALPIEDWSLIMAGKRSRPPKFSTDALKDANTVIALRTAGFSGTTAFARISASYEDEIELRAGEAVFEKAHGIAPLVIPGAPGAPPPNQPSVAGSQPTPTPEPSGPAPSAPEAPPTTPAAPAAVSWLGRIIPRKRTQ